MGILLGLLGEIRKWDNASKLALLIAIGLLSFDIFVLFSSPNLQNPALIGAVGLLIAIQLIFLWGNRTLISPYSQAQKHFLNGDFEAARDVLKPEIDSNGKKNIDSLVLLGNIYRNLGQLRESESVLRIALAQNQNYHFALYGLGKIRLAMGDYQEAIQHFDKALRVNAPEIIRFDKALAHYFASENELALAELKKMPFPEEIHRKGFSSYLLFRLNNNPITDKQTLVEAMPFWEAEIRRFKNTAYAQALSKELKQIQAIIHS